MIAFNTPLIQVELYPSHLSPASALKKKKEDLHAVTTPDFVQEDPPTGAWVFGTLPPGGGAPL